MDNLRGSLFMVFSMLLFAVEDMLVKLAAHSLPLGEIMAIEGMLGAIIFALVARTNGQSPLPRAFLSPRIATRSAFEVTGRLFYALAITLTPLSSASAILQATPLVVVAAAALVLREPVGWQRWLAIFIGFAGVLMIVRPGTSGFSTLSLLALVGMLGFAGRDLATRMAPPSLSSAQLGVAGFLMLALAGALLLVHSGAVLWPTGTLPLILAATAAVGTIAYHALTKAMRTGEVSAVTPFRYSRLLFGLALGIIVFNEHPDALTLLGSVVIVVSGLYTLANGRSTPRNLAPRRL
ncbi:MAG: DMT family transporter [Paracoccaceae bacterium]|nr:DMT family transporter [Paracoccaceae bacterium]